MASETATSTPALPLSSLHRRLGAALAPLDPGGPAVPLRYGDGAGEYAALRRGCGLADPSWTGRLEVLGADRHRFLNGYLTCDVKGIAPGESAYGFVTSAQGRILADTTVLAHEDRLWLELPAGRAEAVAEHLRRYVLADRVEVLPLDDMLPFALLGPRAGEALAAAAGGALPAALDRTGRHLRARVAGSEVTLERRRLPEGEAWLLWVSASIARLLWEELLKAGAGAGLAPVGAEALETVRVEEGMLRFGRDFGPDNFPQETGRDEAGVSYAKGCYLGQEVVARIHYRGGVQKLARGLLFEEGPGSQPPRPGIRLMLEGREVGTATTVVRSPTLGRAVGLAILHKKGAEPGTRLEAEGGGTALVRELPLS